MWPRSSTASPRRWRAPPIDVNIVPDDGAHRRKKLLVADMESTIIEQECLDELADYVGLRPQIAAITERAMRGELDFEAAIKERVGLLKGLDAGVLDRSLHAARDADAGRPDAGRHHARQRRLLRAGLRRLSLLHARRSRRALGFDTEQANRLDIADGRIAGTVAEPILGREAKLAALAAA